MELCEEKKILLQTQFIDNLQEQTGIDNIEKIKQQYEIFLNLLESHEVVIKKQVIKI